MRIGKKRGRGAILYTFVLFVAINLTSCYFIKTNKDKNRANYKEKVRERQGVQNRKAEHVTRTREPALPFPFSYLLPAYMLIESTNSLCGCCHYQII